MVLYLHHTMHSPHRPGKTLEEKQMQGKNGKKSLHFVKRVIRVAAKHFMEFQIQ